MKQTSVGIELQPDNSQVRKEKDLQYDPTFDETNPKYKSPPERANILSYLNFAFMFSTIRNAKKLLKQGKSLNNETLPGIPYRRRPEVIEEKFFDELFQQRKNNPRKKTNLALAIIKSMKWLLLSCISLEITTIFLRIFLVWIAKRLLDALSDMNASDSEGYKWAGILSGVLITALYAEHHYYYLTNTIPSHIRSGLVSMIYTKISRLSVYSLNEITLGKLVNLVANDVNVFERTGMFFPSLIVGVIGLCAGTALLWTFFGPCCLVGIGYCIIGFPIQQAIASLSDKPRKKKNDVTDERVKLTSEVIDGIRLLKMYTWELTFRDIIAKIREREINLLRNVASLEGTSRGLALSTQLMACFLIWMTYALTGNEITVSIVFPSIFLIGLVRMHSVFFFALGLGFISEAKLVIRRLETILDAPEVGDISFEEPNNKGNSVEFDGFCAYWTAPKGGDKTLQTITNEQFINTDNQRATLFDICVDIKKGSLNALIGKVGSGKSSFLLSFTGEMPRTDGSLRYKGSIAYVEQEPTIFAGTLRENILFGKAYEPEFYNKVVKVCNLENDILLFPKGDLSEIGEKGINLSGGQKARLSLARALYADADIYLLDDPLSAVDAKVAKSLYQDAIMGHLKGKTVILATHQVHFIKDLQNIIMLDDGKIAGNGTYAELVEQNIGVEKLFSTEYRKSMSRMSLPDLNKGSENIGEIQLRKRGENELEEEDEEEQEVEERKIDDDKGKLFSSEDAHAGEVNVKTYITYMSNMGGKLLIVLFLLFLSNELANVAFSRIAGVWAEGELDRNTSLGIMGGLTGLAVIVAISKSVLLSLLLLKSARSLHDKMLDRILRNPVQFFDTNPVGRILNRFSNDLGVLDRFLQMTLNDVVDQAFTIGSTIITIAVINPFILIPIGAALVAIVFILGFFYQAIIQARNYDLSSRSPLYSLFSSSLSGIIVIRSYKQTDMFVQKFRTFLNNNTKGSIGFLTASRFFGFCVDVSYNLAAIACIFIVTATKNSNPGLSGLSIAYILSISGSLQYSLRQMVQSNVLMASVGRIKAYCDTKTESALTLPEDNEPSKAGWPQEGNIQFNKVYMKYRENTDHVIRDLSLCAKPGEKIGCVGRTGAGKSSIIQILFRMMEIDNTAENPNESFVKIDGIDSQSVGLHKLRNSISIIPQTPFVFTGTIKRNLDPIGKFTDEQLWEVLEDVDLKSHVEKLDGQLYTDMTNASSVFSVGQKQLICLARAILKQSKILVLDEATANVDMETDTFIQKKIMEKFSECTIFTIAHRLSTIANYDKILVLDKGRKVEFDEPYKLLVKEIGDDHITNESGHFASMVLNTGPKTSKQILKLAKAKYIDNRSEQL